MKKKKKKGLKKKTTKKKKGSSVLANIAKKALIVLPDEKSFKFYRSIGNPLGIAANSLRSFIDALKKVDVASIEFHSARGDFSKWVSDSLKDKFLAKSLKVKGLSGEKLRKALLERVEKRYKTLTKALKQIKK